MWIDAYRFSKLFLMVTLVALLSRQDAGAVADPQRPEPQGAAKPHLEKLIQAESLAKPKSVDEAKMLLKEAEAGWSSLGQAEQVYFSRVSAKVREAVYDRAVLRFKTDESPEEIGSLGKAFDSLFAAMSFARESDRPILLQEVREIYPKLFAAADKASSHHGWEKEDDRQAALYFLIGEAMHRRILQANELLGLNDYKAHLAFGEFYRDYLYHETMSRGKKLADKTKSMFVHRAIPHYEKAIALHAKYPPKAPDFEIARAAGDQAHLLKIYVKPPDMDAVFAQLDRAQKLLDGEWKRVNDMKGEMHETWYAHFEKQYRERKAYYRRTYLDHVQTLRGRRDWAIQVYTAEHRARPDDALVTQRLASMHYGRATRRSIAKDYSGAFADAAIAERLYQKSTKRAEASVLEIVQLADLYLFRAQLREAEFKSHKHEVASVQYYRSRIAMLKAAEPDLVAATQAAERAVKTKPDDSGAKRVLESATSRLKLNRRSVDTTRGLLEHRLRFPKQKDDPKDLNFDFLK